MAELLTKPRCLSVIQQARILAATHVKGVKILPQGEGLLDARFSFPKEEFGDQQSRLVLGLAECPRNTAFELRFRL